MLTRTNCPVCSTTLEGWTPHVDGRDCELFECSVCGDFIATMECIEDLPGVHRDVDERRLRISHALRKMGRQRTRQVFHSTLAAQFASIPLPRPREQSDNLVRWLGENLKHLGDCVDLQGNRMRAVCGTHSVDGFDLIMGELLKSELVYGSRSMGSAGTEWAFVTLTFDGWDYFEDLIRGQGAHGRGFMAMEYGHEDLDRIFGEVFVPGALGAGFELRRLSDEPKAGLIDNRMRVEIQNAVFLVADLTHSNPGAYWEAGYAEGLGKPVIYTCEKSKFDREKTHFDTSHHYTIIWDAADAKRAGDELKLAIRATLPQLAKMED